MVAFLSIIVSHSMTNPRNLIALAYNLGQVVAAAFVIEIPSRSIATMLVPQTTFLVGTQKGGSLPCELTLLACFLKVRPTKLCIGGPKIMFDRWTVEAQLLP